MIVYLSDISIPLSIANNVINTEDANIFLDRLSPNQPHTYQTFDDDKERKDSALTRIVHGTLDDVLADLTMINASGGGIFVCINATDFKGRTANNVLHVRANFADLDGAPVAPVLVANPAPHVIVETSPNRYSAFWFVDGERLDEFSDREREWADTESREHHHHRADGSGAGLSR
jgi:hypothetical protein